MLQKRTESPVRLRRRRPRRRFSPILVRLALLLLAVGVFFLAVNPFGTQAENQNENRKLIRQSPDLLEETGSHWYWGGIIRDAMDVKDEIWDQLAQAGCEYQIAIHVLTAANKEYAEERIAQSVQQRQETQDSCAPFLIEDEDDVLPPERTPISNRIERIAQIRDVQRERLRVLRSENSPSDKDIVILADLDLELLPPVWMLVDQGEVISNNNQEDVVCAAGITMTSTPEDLRYYDTYSTVLLPDTYVHPLKRRLVKNHYEKEDPRFVRSDSQIGPFTQRDLMRHLQSIASKSPTGNARARSCFGGLSIYRATTWFAEGCRYSDYSPELIRYASAKEGRPCEHVVFHSCLQDTQRMTPARIAINPELVTVWKKEKKGYN